MVVYQNTRTVSPITLPGTGETGREGKKEEERHREEKVVEVK